MTARTIIKAALLLFVGGSLIYLVVNETRPKQRVSDASNHEIMQENPVMKDAGDREQEPAKPPKPQHSVIAYYFHGNMRCKTCRTIEAYTNESLKAGFPDELEAGTLKWRVVNVEEPGNGHFVQDYELSTRSVVLVDMQDGKQERWKNLVRVWELVGERQAFAAYIQEEAKGFLGEQDD